MSYAKDKKNMTAPEQKEREYTTPLSESDRLKVRYVTEKKGRKAILKEFSIQYEALIDSSWRRITRVDNTHGIPHRHIFYPDKKSRKISIGEFDSNKAFQLSLKSLRKTYKSLRRSYEKAYEKIK